MAPRISIVSPAYDEAGNIEQLHTEIREAMESVQGTWEAVYVDDGSTDGTSEVVQDLASRDDAVTAIRLRRNYGQSAALAAGLDAASGDIIVFIDADLQNDPADIPRLMERLDDGYDMVAGWRQDRADPPGKRAASRIASVLHRLVLRTDLHDYGCSLKAFRREAVESLDLYDGMHRYIPALLDWRGYRMTEMPVSHRPRTSGETKYGWRRLPKGFLDMLTVWFRTRFADRPLHVFGGVGLLSIAIGGAAGLYATVQKVVHGASLSDTALPLFAVFMVMIGLQSLLTGFLADILVRTHRDAAGPGYDVAAVYS